jgi:hypothetical protein
MHASSALPQHAVFTQHEQLAAYRARPSEIERVDHLMGLIPDGLQLALDIGARDGHLSHAIAQKVPEVIALDLECPQFSCPRVRCVKGDATDLQFEASSIDLVFCAEVLEHIPGKALDAACAEMARVARQYVVIGVPYMQDLRQGKTTCYSCGGVNPPWGHVNSFDEQRLAALFPSLHIKAVSFVGKAGPRTNALSSALMNYAGNPFGTYVQEEGCVHCAAKLLMPPGRSFPQKVATKLAAWLDKAQALTQRPSGNWIHVLFEV